MPLTCVPTSTLYTGCISPVAVTVFSMVPTVQGSSLMTATSLGRVTTATTMAATITMAMMISQVRVFFFIL